MLDLLKEDGSFALHEILPANGVLGGGKGTERWRVIKRSHGPLSFSGDVVDDQISKSRGGVKGVEDSAQFSNCVGPDRSPF